MNLKLLGLTLFTLLGSGCASVTRGTMDSLQVESTPVNADVIVHRKDKPFTKKEIKKNKNKVETENGVTILTSTTPVVFQLARKGEYEVSISKTGYEDINVDVQGQISGAGGAGMAGNVILGGIIGAGIDASTGAMKDLKPNPIDVSLEPEEAPTENE